MGGNVLEAMRSLQGGADEPGRGTLWAEKEPKWGAPLQAWTPVWGGFLGWTALPARKREDRQLRLTHPGACAHSSRLPYSTDEQSVPPRS